MNVLVAGSSGLIGTALVDRLEVGGHRVIRLVRRDPGPPTTSAVRWDPREGTYDRAALAELGPIDAAVNLAGAGIGDRRWSAARKQELRDSRVDSTRSVAELLGECRPRPRVLVNASAVGYYGDGGDELLTETSTNGTGFLADLCRQWEETTGPAADAGIRTVVVRSGIVLAPQGGALGRQLPLFRLGLGGRLGPGTQFRSWISLEDELSAVVRCLEDDSLSGPVNLTAPEPVTDATFAAALGRALHRPALLPAPATALRLVLGREMASELLLYGQRVVPTALDARDFEFAHPGLDDALRWVLDRG
ncbi:MAG: TIGR01777 family oxidoreductase [Acidimicrobiales bacterium]